MSAHTPGEWIVQSDRSVRAGAITVCEVLSGGAGIEAADANARLIAAAPDMLRALQMLADTGRMEDGEWWREAIEARDAAIAKATEAT